MKTRTALALTLAAGAALGLSACGSSTSTPATPAPAVTASTVTEALPAPTEPIPTTCPEFAMTAAHMATDWQYLGLNLGTTNDESPTLANLKAGVAGMQDLAPTCAPKATASIDAFAAAVEAIQPVYTTQPEGDQVQAVDDGLARMQEAGIQMFADLGMSDYAWK